MNRIIFPIKEPEKYPEKCPDSTWLNISLTTDQIKSFFSRPTQPHVYIRFIR